ncbi:MAG: hypothetical protein FWC38_00565 [Proteobacteria bacterium]|nr:hypothetical protein [Pseudomonadota bacterium]MCL2306734.1 hypothetical protein [Pseudomonadota bacterium]
MTDTQKTSNQAKAPTAPDASLPPCEVFRVGAHTTSTGERLSYSAADLDQIAASYDPVNAPAPIVVGHPATDAPAYGWVKSFKRVGDKLVAEAEDVNPQFASLVKNKAYRKISMAFFRPNEASNPKPGVWYPRHWGFLGAAAPAVPGLKPVTWSGGNDGVVEFSYALTPSGFGAILSRLRDFLIDQFGAEKADAAIPEYYIADLYRQAGAESVQDETTFTATGAAPSGSSLLSDAGAEASSVTTAAPTTTPQPPEDQEMSDQEKKELERLRAENAALQQQQQAAAREARRAEFAALTEKLKAEGKLPAAEAAGAIEFALALPNDSEVEFVAFGCQAATKVNSVQWFKGFLERLQPSIPLGEAAKQPVPGAAAPVAFAAPNGVSVDRELLDIHNKAEAYASQNKTDYWTAVKAVGGK